MSARYQGKPLLRLLELYVLWTLGKLQPADEANLAKIAEKLTKLYGGDGTWQSAIATAMHLPETMPQSIRNLWKHNTGIAEKNGDVLDPQRFAEMFVDANLT